MATAYDYDHEPSLSERVLSVSQLTAQLKDVVERQFSSVWVAGEISNFSRPQSGHCYFTLKDDVAQLRAVIWRGAATKLKFDLHDGLEVVCRGALDVYPPRGSYQMVVSEIEPRGIGALELALRKLREKFAAEGLFDADRKRSLPPFPKRIGFVTSPTGAAIHDFLQVLRRRWSGVEVFVFPAKVQGTGAAEEIAAGIKLANRMRPSLDVLVVGRGGGSLEDLWAFNEEPVVRAIAASRIPTVSAVGHEIDVTLADLVADVRALTPTEAAERVVPSSSDVSAMVKSIRDRINRSLELKFASYRQRLDALATRPALARPLDAIHNQSRVVDELGTRLHGTMKVGLRDRQQQLAAVSGKLDSLSPLAVLGRGYSLTQDAKSGRLITVAGQLKPGQEIRTRLGEGEVISTVKELKARSSRSRQRLEALAPKSGDFGYVSLLETGMAKKKETDADLCFEDALKELEGIVGKLESGKLGLEDSLAQYEQGVRHLKQCYQLLEHAERRIELVNGLDAEGNPITVALDEDDDSTLAAKGDARSRRRTATATKAAKHASTAEVDDESSLF